MYLEEPSDAFIQHALLATPEGVMFLNSSSGLTESVIPMGYGAGGVDFHVRRREVYAIMHTNIDDTNYIIRVSEIGNGEEVTPNWYKKLTLVLKPSCTSRPKNLVVDWVQDEIYWTCTEGGELGTKIMGASITNGHGRVLEMVTKPLNGLSLDPFQKNLFWLNGFALTRYPLQESSSMEKIQQFNLNKDSTMAVDINKQIIYIARNNQLLEVDYELNTKRIIIVKSWPSYWDSSVNPHPKVVEGRMYQVMKRLNSQPFTVNRHLQPIYTDLTVTDWILHVPCWQQDDCSTECQRPWSDWIMSSAECNELLTLSPLVEDYSTEAEETVLFNHSVGTAPHYGNVRSSHPHSDYIIIILSALSVGLLIFFL